MRTLKLFILLVILGGVFSCSKDELTNNEVETKKNNEQLRNSNGNKRIPKSKNAPQYSNNKLIIQYKDGVHDSLKVKFRNYHQISNRQFEDYDILGTYKVCDLCPDASIELWTFTGGDIDIEHKSGSIQSGGGDSEGIVKDVDYEFTVIIEKDENKKLGLNTHLDYLSKRVTPDNPGVTIAVLDSGVNPYFFDTPFLYNADLDAVENEKSGWDFVNSDADAFDDNPNLHGTIVTSIVTKTLESLNIPHQIIPLKICDEEGKASYFSMVCGNNYALSRATILQMSVGWYEEITSATSYSSILPSLIKEKEDKVLFINSAGNNGLDTDTERFHFPSGYSLFTENVLSIASTNQLKNNISYFSNYGLETVHFYAVGENVPFDDLSGAIDPHLVSGTSFAAPYVAAKAAEIYYNGTLSTSEMIFSLNTSGTDTPASFDVSKLTKYSKIIN